MTSEKQKEEDKMGCRRWDGLDNKERNGIRRITLVKTAHVQTENPVGFRWKTDNEEETTKERED